MEEAQWSDVLMLLAVMVIVDGKVFKEETDAFIDEAVNLRELIGFEAPFARKTAFDWYVANRDVIRARYNRAELHSSIIDHIENLNGSAHANEILASMNRIAVADENFHPKELTTILFAAECWGIEPPSLKP